MFVGLQMINADWKPGMSLEGPRKAKRMCMTSYMRVPAAACMHAEHLPEDGTVKSLLSMWNKDKSADASGGAKRSSLELCAGKVNPP